MFEVFGDVVNACVFMCLDSMYGVHGVLLCKVCVCRALVRESGAPGVLVCSTGSISGLLVFATYGVLGVFLCDGHRDFCVQYLWSSNVVVFPEY